MNNFSRTEIARIYSMNNKKSSGGIDKTAITSKDGHDTPSFNH